MIEAARVEAADGEWVFRTQTGQFDATLARKQVVAVNAMAVAMQARNLRRMTDRALALIEARLAALMPANPRGRPPQPAGKPDGQPAGSDAAEPGRLSVAACRRRRRPDTELRAWAGDPFPAANVLRRRLLACAVLNQTPRGAVDLVQVDVHLAQHGHDLIAPLGDQAFEYGALEPPAFQVL